MRLAITVPAQSPPMLAILRRRPSSVLLQHLRVDE